MLSCGDGVTPRAIAATFSRHILTGTSSAKLKNLKQRKIKKKKEKQKLKTKKNKEKQIKTNKNKEKVMPP